MVREVFPPAAFRSAGARSPCSTGRLEVGVAGRLERRLRRAVKTNRASKPGTWVTDQTGDMGYSPRASSKELRIVSPSLSFDRGSPRGIPADSQHDPKLCQLFQPRRF